MFGTFTKDDATSASFETLKDICSTVDIPVVAIGGINKDNMMQLKGTGVDGICVISAIFAQDDIAKATRVLAKQCDLLVQN